MCVWNWMMNQVPRSMDSSFFHLTQWIALSPLFFCCFCLLWLHLK
jgi:hypothetical protein